MQDVKCTISQVVVDTSVDEMLEFSQIFREDLNEAGLIKVHPRIERRQGPGPRSSLSGLPYLPSGACHHDA